MKSSLQFRFSMTTALIALVGFVITSISLSYFYSYKDEATKILSGDQKTYLTGQLLESKILALDANLESTVSSEEGQELFKQTLQKILDEYTVLVGNNLKDSAINDAKIASEDLFVSYRNIKTVVFQFYREAWANKWMNVASTLGIILNDFDNIPYTKGDKTVSGVLPKFNQMINVVSHSTLNQATKLNIIAKINNIKSNMTKFSDGIEKSRKILLLRKELLKILSENVHAYNEKQSKHFQGFINGSHNGFLISFILFMLSTLATIGIIYFSNKSFSENISNTVKDIVKQLAAWISPSGAPTTEEITKNKQCPVEFYDLVDISTEVIKRVNQLRKEDGLLKKNVTIPYALLSKSQKKIVYWNSSLSILAKSKSIDESGAVPYSNIMKFTDVTGKNLDVIEKCLVDDKETTQLALFKSGSDQIAVQVTCLPVSSTQNENDYIYIQVRDLREENRRLENELERQLENVKNSVAAIKERKSIPAPLQGTRKIIIDSLSVLDQVLSDIRLDDSNRRKEIEQLWSHLEKESELKSNINRRLLEVRNETHAVFSELEQFTKVLSQLKHEITRLAQDDLEIKNNYKMFIQKSKDVTELVNRTKFALFNTLQEFTKSEQITKQIFNHEKTINQLMQKTSLMNLNNMIIESKTKNGIEKSLNPESLMMITDNLNQILYQFQQTYRIIEKSIHEMNIGYSTTGLKIKEQLKSASEIISKDIDFASSVQRAELELGKHQALVDRILFDISEIEKDQNRIQVIADGIEKKSSKMIDITNMNLKLHEKYTDTLTQLSTGTDS